jgi:cation transporter-like permease
MRLRFTIRDLLWLTAVVGLAVGWWLDHRDSQIAHHPLFKILPPAAQQKVLDNVLDELNRSK